MLESIRHIENNLGLDERGFLHFRFSCESGKIEYNVKQAKRHIDSIVSLCDGKTYPFLIDCRDALGSMNYETSKLLTESPELNEVRKAEAFIVDSLAIRLLLKFYIKQNKAHCQSKIFNCENDAIEWLKQFT